MSLSSPHFFPGIGKSLDHAFHGFYGTGINLLSNIGLDVLNIERHLLAETVMLDLSLTGLQILEKAAAYAVHIAWPILSECRSAGSLPDYDQKDFKEKQENWGLDTPAWPLDGRI
jgi:hypothetical protein